MAEMRPILCRMHATPAVHNDEASGSSGSDDEIHDPAHVDPEMGNLVDRSVLNGLHLREGVGGGRDGILTPNGVQRGVELRAMVRPAKVRCKCCTSLGPKKIVRIVPPMVRHMPKAIAGVMARLFTKRAKSRVVTNCDDGDKFSPGCEGGADAWRSSADYQEWTHLDRL